MGKNFCHTCDSARRACVQCRVRPPQAARHQPSSPHPPLLHAQPFPQSYKYLYQNVCIDTCPAGTKSVGAGKYNRLCVQLVTNPPSTTTPDPTAGPTAAPAPCINRQGDCYLCKNATACQLCMVCACAVGGRPAA